MENQIKQNRNWKKYLLIGSVGLNLVFAGLIAGAAIKGPPKHHSSVSVANMRAVMMALPEDKRKELRANFEQNKEKNKFDRVQFRAAKEDITNAIEAVPFNRSVLENALNQQQNLVSVAAQSSSQAFVEVIANMTDDERATFSKNMRELRNKSKRNKDK
ncbi:hypothetical protein BFP76_04260 [Amylibacter kogurei]|uniref:Periplasmic heavy metal sensor n=1 Tax=Paramylibacter kogurei TaxID=1889778 RepID=A0A2G5K4H4_9RHOB|nr:periplasmic heavy metal sensor [Amylibacter kogurei]PIB24426.1 hypothetical protein BFP76_04260 [Amylibacter kogurei]